ncbi:Glu-tRNA(Gln) amidotransferase GatDE subunit E [Candidatus Woesearchaeota archaeon CG10_big_fil_rev_8_21_14_0_10_30_7]|nr:MAG: Glu-tRNA(Gln) amidotransferase GatDE subunit E [Candidatus Woesearchaeota archaeon CG10_big_fil_rev_8_21_14_0_10_30_7]
MNYKELGLKCGLELHIQLEGKKLFCNCQTLIRDDAPDLEIERRLRASAGETGVADVAALQEMQKGKYFIYQAYTDSTCLVELDESPPLPINQQALNAVLQVAKILKADILPQVRMMRKTIVDGSNVSGFQRTGLVALNGELTTSQGKVGIPTIIIEEDANRIIENTKEFTIYRLDRLGIPLVEISTTPDIISPEHAKEVAETLGMILRSTGHAKRGLGTVRQDVNVSISKGNRVEIKGAQDLKMIPTLVEYEVLRQKNLFELKIKKQKPLIIDVTELFKTTESKILQNKFVLGIKLEEMKEILGKEIQPGRRYGTELSDRAKIIAGVGGLFHSDELPKYGITEIDVRNVKKMLNCKINDAFILIADTKERAEKALNAVINRINESSVPKEVRNANPDGTSSYLRPMPGAARMYPETDIPVININAKNVELPELFDAKIKKFQKFGLSKDLAEKLVKKTNYSDLFETLMRFKKIKPAFIAEVLVNIFDLNDKPIEQTFEALNNGKITQESVLRILSEYSKAGKLNLEQNLMSEEDIRREIKKIIAEKKGLAFNALMGLAMHQLKGKAEGKLIARIVKEEINN